MEESVRRIGVLVANDFIGEILEGGVRFMVFVETARNFTFLVTAEKKRLIGAGFGVVSIECVDNFGSCLENFRAFDTGPSNGNFTM